MSSQGQRRARKTQARKGKLKRELIWYQRPRTPEGVRHGYDEKGGFQMGSSPRGSSQCSRRCVDHWMQPDPDGGFNCVNPGCAANC